MVKVEVEMEGKVDLYIKVKVVRLSEQDKVWEGGMWGGRYGGSGGREGVRWSE